MRRVIDGQHAHPPDAPEAQALLVAALEVLREKGAGGLTVADVLARTSLGTRAFYRLFESKDRLIVEAFALAARAEAQRLQAEMARTRDPVAAVTVWIEGRLELAFDEAVESDLRYVSQQAQAVNSVAPTMMATVYAEMLAPVVAQLARGRDLDVFPLADPVGDARAIQSVVWGCVERQWAEGGADYRHVRAQVVTFCLRGLGAPPDQVLRAVRSRRRRPPRSPR